MAEGKRKKDPGSIRVSPQLLTALRKKRAALIAESEDGTAPAFAELLDEMVAGAAIGSTEEDKQIASDVLAAYHGGTKLVRQQVVGVLASIATWKKEKEKNAKEATHADSAQKGQPAAVAGGRHR